MEKLGRRTAEAGTKEEMPGQNIPCLSTWYKHINAGRCRRGAQENGRAQGPRQGALPHDRQRLTNFSGSPMYCGKIVRDVYRRSSEAEARRNFKFGKFLRPKCDQRTNSFPSSHLPTFMWRSEMIIGISPCGNECRRGRWRSVLRRQARRQRHLRRDQGRLSSRRTSSHPCCAR